MASMSATLSSQNISASFTVRSTLSFARIPTLLRQRTLPCKRSAAFSSSRLHLNRSVLLSASQYQQGSSGQHVEDSNGDLLNHPKASDVIHTWETETKESENLRSDSSDSFHNSTASSQSKEENSNGLVVEATSNGANELEGNTSQASASASNQKSKQTAKIHDFCLGIPYGGMLVGGGLLAFFMSGNLIGLILGAAVLGLSVSSLQVWKKGKSSTPYTIGQAVLTFLLLARQLEVFFMNKKLFPTGCIVAISAAMLAFYSYVFASGGNPPPKKFRVSSTT
eukprot:TRINITY_DN31488_c0_g1_i1.p1 TRINITY_DN31488_c0_g1~~TRINITY_DN31488_c0_g1_i1.p1  ORF type:complete len:281 (-),score=64.31 TRINITY_DN31488_c0_g1_i1:140-982(-)